MKTDKAYLTRILQTGGFASITEGDYVILEQKTVDGYTLSIAERSTAEYESGCFEFWLQGDCAWVELTLPKPTDANAWLSGTVRWIVAMILHTPIDKVWQFTNRQKD